MLAKWWVACKTVTCELQTLGSRQAMRWAQEHTLMVSRDTPLYKHKSETMAFFFMNFLYAVPNFNMFGKSWNPRLVRAGEA